MTIYSNIFLIEEAYVILALNKIYKQSYGSYVMEAIFLETEEKSSIDLQFYIETDLIASRKLQSREKWTRVCVSPGKYSLRTMKSEIFQFSILL